MSGDFEVVGAAELVIVVVVAVAVVDVVEARTGEQQLEGRGEGGS